MQLIRYNWQLNPFLWSFFSSSAGDGQFALFDTIWPMFQNLFSSWSLTTCQTYLATTSVPSLPLARLSALEKVHQMGHYQHIIVVHPIWLFIAVLSWPFFFIPQLLQTFLQFLFSQWPPGYKSFYVPSTSFDFRCWWQMQPGQAKECTAQPRGTSFASLLSFWDSLAGNMYYVPKTLSSTTSSTRIQIPLTLISVTPGVSICPENPIFS